VDVGAIGCRQTRCADAVGGARRRPDGGDAPPFDGLNVCVITCLVRDAWSLLQSAAARPAEPAALVVHGVDTTAANLPAPLMETMDWALVMCVRH